MVAFLIPWYSRLFNQRSGSLLMMRISSARTKLCRLPQALLSLRSANLMS